MAFLAFKGSNKLFSIFFAILFFVLSFWVIQPVSDAEALGAECYDDAGVCKYDDVAFLSSDLICTINIGADPYIGFGLGGSSCSSGSGAAKRYCNKISCPSVAESELNGKLCEIREGSGFIEDPLLAGSGVWDYSENQCVGCSGKKETSVCGGTTGIYVNLGACVGMTVDVFESACGASAACDEKDIGDVCVGGTCDVNGNCVAVAALVLTAASFPSSPAMGATSTITFTVRKSGILISGATVSGIAVTAGLGSVAPASCTTSGGGTCTVIYTAPAAATIATISAVKASNGIDTDSGSASASVTVTSCSGSNYASYDADPYGVGDTVQLDGYNTNNFSLCIYDSDSGGMLKQEGNFCFAATPKYITFVADSSGTWKGLSVPGCAPGSCPDPFDVTVGCPGSTTVIAAACVPATCAGCANGTACPGGTCSGGTCVPAGPPNINIGSCIGCSGTVSGGCLAMSGIDLWTAGSVPTDAASCAADFQVSGICAKELGAGFAGCQMSLSSGGSCTCTGGPGGEDCAVAGDEDGNGLADCADTAACPDGAGCAGGGTCSAGVCAIVAPPPPTCSGSGMFVSPLGIGYCSIGEILTNATNWILSLVASIIVLIIIIGGLMYISSAGDEEKLRTSKNIIYYAVIGLGLILISYALITEVTNILEGP